MGENDDDDDDDDDGRGILLVWDMMEWRTNTSS